MRPAGANTVFTITLAKGDLWRRAVAKAYERLRLDPRVKVESISEPEYIDGNEGARTWHVTADTKGGDMLKIVIRQRGAKSEQSTGAGRA